MNWWVVASIISFALLGLQALWHSYKRLEAERTTTWRADEISRLRGELELKDRELWVLRSKIAERLDE